MRSDYDQVDSILVGIARNLDAGLPDDDLRSEIWLTLCDCIKARFYLGRQVVLVVRRRELSDENGQERDLPACIKHLARELDLLIDNTLMVQGDGDENMFGHSSLRLRWVIRISQGARLLKIRTWNKQTLGMGLVATRVSDVTNAIVERENLGPFHGMVGIQAAVKNPGIIGGWAQRPTGEIAVELFSDVGSEATGLIAVKAEALEAWFGDTRIKPRFRSPLQKRLSA